MLTWYYEIPKNNVIDLLDGFNLFEELSSKRIKSSKDTTIHENGIKIEMPGVRSSDLDITVEGRTLKIKGKSRHGKEFSYSYCLNQSIDESAITASLQDGLLELNLPKKEEASIRKIIVSS